MSVPCKFDHNGECLICDCWPIHCGYIRLLKGDFKWENAVELLKIFDSFLTDDEKSILRKKYIDQTKNQYKNGLL